MTETTSCPGCGARLAVPRLAGGSLVSCPRCSHVWPWTPAGADPLPLRSAPAPNPATATSAVPILRDDRTQWPPRERPPATSADNQAKAFPRRRRLLRVMWALGHWLLSLAAFAGFLAGFFWYYRLPPVVGAIVFAVFGSIATVGMILKPREDPRPAGRPVPPGPFQDVAVVFCPRCRAIDLYHGAVMGLLAGLLEPAQPFPKQQCSTCGHTYDWTAAPSASLRVACPECGEETSLPDAETVVREMRAWGNVQTVCPTCTALLRVKVLPT